MTPRTKKTENDLMQEDVLEIRPVIEGSSEEEDSERAIPAQPAKRGRPRREQKPDSVTLPLTLGAELQQARQSMRLKLPSISKKLKIKEFYLDALEKGDYHVFSALVYATGFLRTYATFLGLDADEVIARFHKETSGITEEPLDLPRSHDSKVLPSVKVLIGSLICLFLLYLFWNFYQIMTDNPMAFLEKPIPERAVEVVPQEGPAPITADEVADVVVSETIVPETVEKNKNKAETPISEQKSDKNSSAVYGLKEPARVAFVATGKTTIEIRDTEANRALLKKDLKAGDRYHPNADSNGLILKTTNAGALDVYVDGKKIKTLGKKGQVRSDIQLNADYLLKD